MRNDPKKATDILKQALAYAAMGLHVLPVHAPLDDGSLRCSCQRPTCKHIGKHPALTNGVHGATAREDLIRSHFANYPRNLGIATGKISNLVVIDVDRKNGGLESLRTLTAAGKDFDTPCVVNTGGGGKHFYFRHPGTPVKNSAGLIAAGIDLRGDGGYVIAPPSRHASGRGYHWQADEPNWISDVPQLPQWLERHVSSSSQIQDDGGIQQGGRNTALTSIAGRLRRNGADYEKILNNLLVVNEERCRPPLATIEVTEVASSVARYASTGVKRVLEVCDAGSRDREVNDSKRQKVANPVSPIPHVLAWAEPVNGDELMALLVEKFENHLSVTKADRVVLALWVIFTHAHDCFATSPILAVLSPDKRCGKTTLLTCLRLLVAKPLAVSNITPAAVFRAIDQWSPTLLIDEADTFLEANEELRGILNSGHKRDLALVIRSSGENHDPKCFSTWSPKAIAKIGTLSSTLADRSIAVLLRRKKSDQSINRLDDAARAEMARAGQMTARWVADHSDDFKSVQERQVPKLNDRAQENWQPLLTIAALVSKRWLEEAESSARALSSAAGINEDESNGSLLLKDIFALFRDKEDQRLASADLARTLGAMEDRPWSEFVRFRPITPRQIAQILKAFGVGPRTIRLGDSLTLKGYHFEDFEDAFSRYLTD